MRGAFDLAVEVTQMDLYTLLYVCIYTCVYMYMYMYLCKQHIVLLALFLGSQGNKVIVLSVHITSF